jgi:hypothetical protein
VPDWPVSKRKLTIYLTALAQKLIVFSPVHRILVVDGMRLFSNRDRLATTQKFAGLSPKGLAAQLSRQ